MAPEPSLNTVNNSSIRAVDADITKILGDCIRLEPATWQSPVSSQFLVDTGAPAADQEKTRCSTARNDPEDDGKLYHSRAKSTSEHEYII